MNNMSESTMRASCTKENFEYSNTVVPIDESDIIDVSVFNFNDHDRWLCESTQCYSESKVRDLCAWLRCSPDLETVHFSKANKKSIDTRTYTRPKRRSHRLNFETVIENLSSSKTQNQKTEMYTDYGKEMIQQSTRKSTENSFSVPFMLQPSSSALPFSGLVNNNHLLHMQTSGEESMDAFINMSQSQGVDSFINMTEPEFNDILMNISQPSFLQSSLITSSFRDESSAHLEMMDSQILTDSMMQTSMFDETKNIQNFYTPFENENLESTIVQMKSDTSSPVNSTLLNQSEMFRKEQHNDFNLTFPATAANEEIVESNNTLASECMSQVKENSSLNNTYLKNETAVMNMTMALNTQEKPCSEIIGVAKNDDITFNIQSEIPVSEISLNKTFEAIPSHAQVVEPMKPKVVTTLRQELLKEVKRGGVRKQLDTTFNINSQKENVEQKINYMCDQTSNLQHSFVENNAKTCKFPAESASNDNDHKFQTYSIKNYNTWTKEEKNLDSTFQKLPTQIQPSKKLQRKLPAPQIFSKLPQYVQKSNPNLLSSSLNVVNVTEHINKPSLRYTKGSQPNITTNMDKSLGKNLSTLGKLKSGSDQRIMEVTHTVSDFHISGTDGSTESIESMQSAHSAPDLDDRLSVCSDSSRGSYTIGKVNSEYLHKIVQMQEESLNHESTPKPNRQLLDTNWMVNENDLPSPIAKDGTESIKKHVEPSLDSTFKTSSPILSPAESELPIGTVDSVDKDDICSVEQNEQRTTVKKSDTLVKRQRKTSAVMDTKSKLKPPTNFNIGNRPSNVTSGIPRPMSRIPAPKSTRPKTAQSESKKGYS